MSEVLHLDLTRILLALYRSLPYGRVNTSSPPVDSPNDDPTPPSTRADIRRPQTSAMVTSSSRASPTAGRPAKPGTPGGMFKKQHSPLSPSFVPGTPKLPKLSLPEEPSCTGPSRPATRADIRRPITSAVVTSSSRASPTAGQPVKPLKSILKGSKNAQSLDSYESEGEMLTAKKIARSQYNIPNVLPPGSRLGKYAFDPAPLPLDFLPTLQPIQFF